MPKSRQNRGFCPFFWAPAFGKPTGNAYIFGMLRCLIRGGFGRGGL
jgi:hypothetical protein